MSRNKPVTAKVLEGMKMLHEQGVKVSMIADVFGYTAWTVYKGRDANWDFSTYKKDAKTRLAGIRKSVKSKTASTNGSATSKVSTISIDEGVLNKIHNTLQGIETELRLLTTYFLNSGSVKTTDEE
jgi:hypothetical protein|tara:strand:+ start:430 stop:807 length:378 start_codon:yes stop_codon:yes gene_type:complete